MEEKKFKRPHYAKEKRERDYELYHGKVKKANILDENKEKILEFIELQKAKNRSLSSQVHYMNTLQKFCLMFPKKRFKDINQQETIQFKKWLDSKYKPRTIAGHMAELKYFLKWLNGGEYAPDCIKWFKSSDIKFEKKFKAKDILSQEEIIKLSKSTDPKMKTRDSALVLTLWESGCRAGEWAKIRKSDIAIEDGTYTVSISGKTGERDVFLINSAPSMAEWLEAHPFKADEDFFVWCGLGKGSKKEHLRRENIYRIIRYAAKKSGIKKPITCHALRHSRATFMAKQKFNESMMRQMFGWSPISRMPSTYTSLASSDIKNALLGKNGEQEKAIEPKKCYWCNAVNPLERDFCKQCKRPLSSDLVLAVKQETEKKAEKLVKFLEQNPAVLKQLQEMEI